MVKNFAKIDIDNIDNNDNKWKNVHLTKVSYAGFK